MRMVKLPDGREPLLERESAAANLAVVSNDIATHQQVLPNAEGRKEAPILGHMHHACLENLPRRQSLEGHAVEEDLTGLHGDEATDRSQQCRLAGSVRTDETGHLVTRDVQRCATQHSAVSIPGDDVADFEAGVH